VRKRLRGLENSTAKTENKAAVQLFLIRGVCKRKCRARAQASRNDKRREAPVKRFPPFWQVDGVMQ
jgi:hypothetical protein